MTFVITYNRQSRFPFGTFQDEILCDPDYSFPFGSAHRQRYFSGLFILTKGIVKYNFIHNFSLSTDVKFRL